MASQTNPDFGGLANGRHSRNHNIFRGREKSASDLAGRVAMTIANFFERLLWLPILFLCGCVAVTALMLMDNAPPGEVVPGSQTAVIESDRLIISYGFIRHRYCAAEVTRSLIDPRGRLEHVAPMTYTPAQVREDRKSVV